MPCEWSWFNFISVKVLFTQTFAHLLTVGASCRIEWPVLGSATEAGHPWWIMACPHTPRCGVHSWTSALPQFSWIHKCHLPNITPSHPETLAGVFVPWLPYSCDGASSSSSEHKLPIGLIQAQYSWRSIMKYSFPICEFPRLIMKSWWQLQLTWT